jgi:hypothetical protein
MKPAVRTLLAAVSGACFVGVVGFFVTASACAPQSTGGPLPLVEGMAAALYGVLGGLVGALVGAIAGPVLVALVASDTSMHRMREHEPQPTSRGKRRSARHATEVREQPRTPRA